MKAFPDLHSYSGIPEAEARQRLANHGFNELPAAQRPGFWATALGILSEPMLLLLGVCAVVYLFLGDIREGLLMVVMIMLVAGIDLYQKRRSEKTLENLRKFSSPRARVIRDGIERRIPGREVVVGDIFLIREGDRVPADAEVLFEMNLAIDESLLTGEAMPVTKADTPPHDSAAEISNKIYSGTMVVQGQAVGRVTAIGEATQVGRLGKTLGTIVTEKSGLQKETGRIVRVFGIIAVLLCLTVIVTFSLRNADWLKAFLAGIALALSLMPEEFPVTLAIFLAAGAWRMAHRNMITRVPAALETLGQITVLCSDKTGTITENKMKIVAISDVFTILELAETAPALPDNFHSVLEYAVLASQIDPFDPMEKAIITLADATLTGTEHLHAEWHLAKEYPLSKKLLAISRVFRGDAAEYAIAAKGAPEAIFELCHFDPTMHLRASEAVGSLAARGLRVIAVAKAAAGAAALPENQHDFDFEFLGFLGFKDPVRQAVPAAITECGRAGIQVLMITGDHPQTAMHIAREIGLPNSSAVLTGQEIVALPDAELRAQLRTTSVFARVSAEQKIDIVRALKSANETVAMTGDGVNDAPALKAADVGIAMGGRGTDVAREASALVLVDDDFSTIVAAIRIGRSIVANLKKAFAFIVASHFPIAALAFVPVLFPEHPVILLPVHIVFIEMVIDPACTLVFERIQNPRIMDFPREASRGIFSRRSLLLSCFQGIAVAAAVLSVHFFAAALGFSEDVSRTLCFVSLIFGNLFLILSASADNVFFLDAAVWKNKALRWLFAAVLAFLSLAVFVAPLRAFFRFDLPPALPLLAGIGFAFAGILPFEIRKIVLRHGNGFR